VSWKVDPSLTAAASSAHALAIAHGEAAYVDPDLGLFVLTASALTGRGTCCGNACRHCPWDWKNVSTNLRDQRVRMQAEGRW
jgi:hypothetical protein